MSFFSLRSEDRVEPIEIFIYLPPDCDVISAVYTMKNIKSRENLKKCEKIPQKS